MDPGVGQRQLGHDADDGRLLRGGALQELGPRRRVEEQVPHLDGRAGGRVGRRRTPPPPRPRPTMRNPRGRVGRPRQERQPRDGEDRGQRLPAEPERADRVEVGLRPELGRRMPLQRQQAVLGRHPAPVVRHRDELAPGAPHRDLDAGRAGVQAVLDQLLDDRRRALDDLPGRDLVDDGVGEALDGRPRSRLARKPPAQLVERRQRLDAASSARGPAPPALASTGWGAAGGLGPPAAGSGPAPPVAPRPRRRTARAAPSRRRSAPPARERPARTPAGASARA